jgi:Tfp pilus assembly protein PilO
VSDPRQGVPLVRRILTEHRRLVYPLLIALVLNVLVYGAFVFPLAQRVANIEERDRAAELELADATRELTRARGITTGKDRAAKELETFYKDVLPPNLTGARRLTSLRLQQLAREAGLRAESTGISEESARGTETLQALQIEMALTGNYPALRAFIHKLEVAPEFVVIDNVQLAEGADGEGALRITMALSTYYRSASP